MSTTCGPFRRPLRARLRVATLAAAAAASAIPAIAQADEPKKDCEPGSWFCGETQTNAGNELQPLPADKPAPAEKTPPPVVVVPPPTVVVQARDAPPPYYYVPRKAPPKKEWGLNLHVGGAMMGKGRDDNAGMALAGLGLRFRPIPYAALEGDLDFAGGRDYNGYRRHETAFALNALVFLNPRSTAQIYFLGGLGQSWASAKYDGSDGVARELTYAYLGVQTGAGLEVRLSKTVALNVDVRGLLRTRIDGDARYTREFTSNGKSTNTSGAGLLQGGITFYW